MVVTDRVFWRWYLILVVFFSGWYLFQWRDNTGTWFLLATTSLILSVLLFVFYKRLNLDKFLQTTIPLPEGLIWVITLLFISIPSMLTFLYPTQIVYHQSGKLLLLLWGSGISVWLLQGSKRKRLSSLNFLFLLLLGGVLFKLGSFVPEVQRAPFALGWSEGSRYYNASLYLSESIYGEKLPLPVLHPTRYLLQSIPFLMRFNSIFIHRAWQVALWIGLVGLGSFGLVKKLKIPNRFIELLLSLWFFMFFFQGAVYYHLMVSVIIVFLGFHRDHPWRTLIIVVISSIWAGMSRVNWIPVPALLAVTMYLLEVSVKKELWLKYLKFPIIWCFAGGLAAIISNRLYAFVSGNEVEQFASSFTSYMIWSRLLPNTTYKPGIVVGLLIVFLPSLFLVFQQIYKNGWKRYLQWMRTFGLLGILFVFGLGGIIVSVKIGGGGDLHNLDAFLVFWLLITTYIIFNRYQFEDEIKNEPMQLNYGLFCVAMIIPLLLVFQKNPVWIFRNVNEQKQEVHLLQEALDKLNDNGEKILFITERQLLTFGEIENVALVPDYEKVFLMEMVMSNNQPYLEEFHQKLANYEFSAIVLDSISTKVQNQKDSFWIENNLWVDKVVYPVLDYYEPVLSIENKTINVLIPRK